MADEEVIGGVAIAVTGDFSDLDAAFEAAVAKAVAEGSTLAEAIQSAMVVPDASGIADAFGQVGAAATNAATQLGLFDEAAHVDYSDATGQLNLFATELEPVAAAASKSAASIADFGSAADLAARPIGSTVVATDELTTAANNAATAGTNAGSAWSGFGSTLAGLTGIALTVDALKELVVGSIEAADKVGDTQQALGILTGSAEQAAGTIEKLKDLAQDEGLSFPGLLTASTRLTALLPEGADVVEVLSKIGNAAELFGTSIDTAAGKFTNLVESGNASVRSLSALGLKMEDIRNAMEQMGVAADKSFKDLDQEDRLNVLTLAMGKLDGAAKQLNDDISGDWVRFMNQAKQAMVDLGDVISPLAQSTMPALSAALKGVEAAAALVFVGLKVLVDGVTGLSGVMLAAISGLGAAWKDAMQGNFTAAAADAVSAFDKIKAASTSSWDDIVKSATIGGDFIKKLYSDDIPKAAAASATGVKGITTEFAAQLPVVTNAVHAIKDWVDISKLASDASTALANELKSAWEKVTGLAGSVEHANEILQAARNNFDGSAKSLQDLNKAADLAVKTWDAYVKSLEAVDKLSDVAGTSQRAFAKSTNDAALAAMDETNAMKGLGAILPAVAAPMSEVNRALADFGIQAANTGTSTAKLKANIDTLISDLPSLNKAFADGQISQADYDKALALLSKDIQQLAKTDLPLAVQKMGEFVDKQISLKAPLGEIQTEMAAYEGMIQKLAQISLPAAIAAQQNYIAELQKIPHSLDAILTADTTLFQMEIKNAQERGESADEWILKLEAVKLKQESLKLSTEGLATTYVGLINDVLKGFDNMSKSIADNIVDGKKWGDVWESLLNTFAKTILETVIQGALAPLKKALVDLISNLLPDVSKGFGLTADGAKALSDAAKDAAASAEKMSAAADQVSSALGSGGGLAGGGSGLAGSVSHLSSIIDVIAEVVAAGAAVASTVILSHISSDTGHIEVNTRGSLAEALNLRADLWSQHNDLYERLGECKNDLDALVAAASTTGGSADTGDLQGTLETISDGTGMLVAGLGLLNTTAMGLLTDANLSVLGLQNINNTLYQVNSTLLVLISRVDAVVSAILYGRSQSGQEMSSLAHAISQSTQAGASQVANAVQAASSADIHQQLADAQAAVASAQAQVNAARNVADQIAALKVLQAADDQMMRVAMQAGDSILAQQYNNASREVANQILALQPGVDQTAINTMQTADAVINGANAVSIAATNSGVMVAAAVGSAAAYIASSVAAAVAAVASFAPAGGGQYQYVPPRGTPTYQQGSESQHPGNSNSPGGNTGISGSSGPAGFAPTGPRTSTIPPPITPPKYDPVYNADGSPFTGISGTTRTPPPYDPNNPNTWNQSTSYDEGGYVPHDMMAKVHAGEWVLPPDVTGMLRQMASNPTGDFGMLNPGGGGGSAGNQTNIFHVYAPSPREAAQQIATYMKTQSRKMAILSS